MKHIPFFLVFISSLFFISCSDTIVTKNLDPSEVKNIEVPLLKSFNKRVLIEDYTGTWCGNCARVSYAIEQVFVEPNNNAVAIAIHAGNDPYKFLGIAPLKNLIVGTAPLNLPEVRLNRTINWIDPDTNINQVRNLTGNNCGLGLSIKSIVAGGNINLDVSVKFAQDFSNLKLIVCALENKLFYKQENYTTYYNNINPILNFEHNHVLRAALTDVLGDSFSENTIKGKTISRNFNIAVPINISNQNNISFVAFVVDSNNLVVNVRDAKANENLDFEENL